MSFFHCSLSFSNWYVLLPFISFSPQIYISILSNYATNILTALVYNTTDLGNKISFE